MALAGKHIEIDFSADGTVWVPIAELHTGQMQNKAAVIDVTHFTDDFIRRIQGLKDNVFTFTGYWAPTDTTGQHALFLAWLNDTAAWIRYLYDGTNGFKQNVKISQFQISGDVTKAVDINVTADGNGALTAVP